MIERPLGQVAFDIGGGLGGVAVKSALFQPLRSPVRILALALHVEKLVVTCRCPVVYSTES